MFNHQQCANFIQSGQVDSAIDGLKQLILSRSKDYEAHQLIGVAYIMIREYKLAEKHLLKCLKLQPKHVDAQYNLARLYTESKKLSKAKQLLVKVLDVRPDWLQARFALGLVCVGLEELSSAKQAFGLVVQAQPNNAEAWFNLGNIEFNQDNFGKAAENYNNAINNCDNYEEALAALASTYINQDKIELAIEMLLEHYDDSFTSTYDSRLASTYRLLGNKQKAQEHALKALSKDPKNGEAHKAYYDAIKVENVEQLEQLKQALRLEGVSKESLIYMNFALGSALESCGEYQEAIKHFDEGNKLCREDIGYTTKDAVRLIDVFKKSYSADNLKNMQGQMDLDSKNIFILGMPRSGTSLVEQILSCHSDVHGAGELNILRPIWRKEGSASEAKFHTKLINQTADKLLQFGQNYIDETSALRTDATWLTDKMPHNFLLIGYLSVVLPNAKIIHCKRHPIANCLSIYKANFSGVHNYAYNQKELAEYHNLYEDLMEHWRKVLPGKFYEIKYEDLTANQEEETRKLIEYCGLEWEDACLDFHKNKRAVKTASAYQVRQKMHSKSVDLWKRYGDGLKPLIDNLYIPEEYQD